MATPAPPPATEAGTDGDREEVQVLVRFEGEGAGVEELSWGQREIWHVIQERKSWSPIGAVNPLPDGYSVDDAVAALRSVMGRYPSMRTRLCFDPDGPKQVVSAAGEIPLWIVDAADHEDPAEVAERIRLRYWDQDLDLAKEWPVRTAVIRHRGRLTHRVWVMCHLVTDGEGSLEIKADLAGRGAGPGAAAGGATPPLEQARWQRSPAGRRQCQAALRYWERILRGVSARRFPEPVTVTRGPRYRQAQFDSPATALAIHAASARSGVEGASVLLAAFAVGLARATGISPVVLVLLVNNRFRPGLARTVSPIMHPGLCTIDVTDTTMDEMLAHTRGRAIAAYKHAYYDPSRREELIARVNRERGEEVDLECSFNDRRIAFRRPAGPPPAPGRIRAALPRTSFAWTQEQDHRPYDRLFVTVEDVPDSIQLTVVTDAHQVSPAHVEACVRGMEEAAVAMALDPTARTGVGWQH
jgi:hypothetical protein